LIADIEIKFNNSQLMEVNYLITFSCATKRLGGLVSGYKNKMFSSYLEKMSEQQRTALERLLDSNATLVEILSEPDITG
jgi:hypothetical protein